MSRRPRPARFAASRGFTLLETVFVLALIGILTAMAIPQTMAGLERSRTIAAARFLAGRLALARSQAVSRSANVALLFQPDATGYTIATYRDGNANGVRTRDIAMRLDPQLEAPVRLSDLFPGVSLSLTDPAREPEPAASALMSFAPGGTASSRTIYLRGRDGSHYAVRVLGVTGRTRVLRYLASTHQWVDTF